MITASQISLIFISRPYCHSKCDPLLNLEFLTIYHLLSTVSREIRSQEISLQWHLDINIHVWGKYSTFKLMSAENNPTCVLTCIRMYLGRRDAHEAAGRPTADRGYLMSSRWLYRGNPPRVSGNSWSWSWSADVSPPAPQLEEKSELKRKWSRVTGGLQRWEVIRSLWTGLLTLNDEKVLC